MPSVSIIMPSYNHGRFVEQAVRSVLNQTFSDLELIIIDDGSKDESATILARLAETDRRIQLIVRANKGAGATLNEGLSLARGTWIGILNSDDYYHPDRLAVLLDRLGKAKADWGFSRVLFVDANDQPATVAEAEQFKNIQNTVSSWPTVGFAFLKNNLALTTGNLFFKRSLLDTVGCFRPLDHVHDWDFALRLTAIAEPVFVDVALYSYRFHGSNTFRALALETTSRETSFLMRSFLRDVSIDRPANPLAPSPFCWPGMFELAIRDLQYGVYMPSAQELDFVNRQRKVAC